MTVPSSREQSDNTDSIDPLTGSRGLVPRSDFEEFAKGGRQAGRPPSGGARYVYALHKSLGFASSSPSTRGCTDGKPVADSIAGPLIDDFQPAVTAYGYGHTSRGSKARLSAVRASSDTV